MAKKFFYVCSGLFLLVLSYHLGAANVAAQSLGIEGIAVRGNYVSWASAGLFNLAIFDSHGISDRIAVPLPKGGSVVATYAINNGAALSEASLIYGDGEAFVWNSGWISSGHIFSGPTAVSPTSWGSVKASYRR